MPHFNCVNFIYFISIITLFIIIFYRFYSFLIMFHMIHVSTQIKLLLLHIYLDGLLNEWEEFPRTSKLIDSFLNSFTNLLLVTNVDHTRQRFAACCLNWNIQKDGEYRDIILHGNIGDIEYLVFFVLYLFRHRGGNLVGGQSLKCLEELKYLALKSKKEVWRKQANMYMFHVQVIHLLGRLKHIHCARYHSATQLLTLFCRGIDGSW